jgi:hypothetical protein
MSKIDDSTEARIAALASWLDVDIDDLDEVDYQDNCFTTGTKEWLVLTDEEADTAAKEDIELSLWAFKRDFLSAYMPEGVDSEHLEKLNDLCEDSNPLILALVGDRLDDLSWDAIASDGRGHFLSGYDGYENEVGPFYVYRTN